MTNSLITEITREMISYYSGDAKRIQHFLKVYEFSKLISQGENLSEEENRIIEVTALMHDIGIKKAEEVYKSCSGKYQEELGPSIAGEIISQYTDDKKFKDKVCYIIGHHHTYENIDSIEYQVIVEADFLVNAYEDNLSQDAINSFCQKVFKTKTGTDLLKTIYCI